MNLKKVLVVCFSIPVSDCLAISLGGAVGRTISDGFLVSLEVKVDEESQVAGQETTSKESGCLTSSAVAHVGNDAIPVCGSKVTPSSKVDDEDINDELSYLHAGQIFLPPNFGSTSGSIVVIIHYDVD